VVFFDRFAIGEWAAKHALEDLTPYIEKQTEGDPLRIDLATYYPWTFEEASYRPPGSNEARRVYGIPTIADARLLYTNLDLLRQEGLTTEGGQPKLPTTWTELRAYATRLSRFRTPGNGPMVSCASGSRRPSADSFLYMFAFQAGGHCSVRWAAGPPWTRPRSFARSGS